jgi:hypothetical protein
MKNSKKKRENYSKVEVVLCAIRDSTPISNVL